MELLSSKATVFLRILLPALFIVGGVFGTVTLVIGYLRGYPPPGLNLLFVALYGLGAFWTMRFASLLWAVALDGSDLVLVRPKASARIPLTAIEAARLNPLGGGILEVSFNIDTPVGRRFWFVPRGTGLPFGSPQTVLDRLYEAIEEVAAIADRV